MIANARASERDFQELETLEDLRKVQVSDYRIHVTGGQKLGQIICKALYFIIFPYNSDISGTYLKDIDLIAFAATILYNKNA